MYCVQEIAPDIFWVGGSDRRLELFENMFPLPNGVAYNSYLIMDEKTALVDTVDRSISQLYLENIAHVLGDRELDYLIVNHMEPDHCANIEEIARRYPNVRLVGNKTTFQFMEQFYELDMTSNYLEVKDGDELSLGRTTFRFYTAPMVHWPEVMVTYEISRGILFSADAFGSFGAFSGNLFVDELDDIDINEARRYYTNIVGRYGSQVQALFKKLAGLEINMICSLHGHIWRSEKIPFILDLYNKWSRYEPEKKGVVLVYASMYGNTENVIQALANKLAQRGIRDMHMYDVSKTHASYIISDLWKYSHMVLASPTYNMHLYFVMDALLKDISVLGLKNRKVSIIGNHTWASAAMKSMKEQLEAMNNMKLVGEPMDVRSAIKSDRETDLDKLADAIYISVMESK
ncbi:MAG: putative flavoprotein [Eubacterium sp.]|nr:putative flavoprotein [Eubacterium sp.]